MSLALSNLQASTEASDNAGNYSNWTDGSNGGTGFGNWSLTGNSSSSGSGGLFLATTSGNPSLSIASSGKAFGLYANSGGTSNAIRPFSGSLAVGQTFSMSFENGNVDKGGNVGIQLLNSSNLNNSPSSIAFSFTFNGGDSYYGLSGASTSSTLPYSVNGITLSFTVTGANTYSFVATEADGPSQTFTGTFSGSIDGIRIYDYNAGGGDGSNFYANNLAVVPEPSTYLGSLLVVLTGGLVVHRKRKTCFA